MKPDDAQLAAAGAIPFASLPFPEFACRVCAKTALTYPADGEAKEEFEARMLMKREDFDDPLRYPIAPRARIRGQATRR